MLLYNFYKKDSIDDLGDRDIISCIRAWDWYK